MEFKPDYQSADKIEANGLFFIFRQNQLLIKNAGDDIAIPAWHEVSGLDPELSSVQHIGVLDGNACYAAALESDIPLPEHFQCKDLRSLFSRLDENLIWVAGRANQLVDWQRTHQYCGACGHLTEDKKGERAKICPQCKLVNYPRLSPAVIMAVTRGDKILLARNNRFKIPMYSVLAGFVEPSETLEQCVHREVREEVGIEVKNIRYFGSQPWPFPNSLMVGFTAEYAGGQIVIDPDELRDADWFTKADLPQTPPTISIAGRLIEWFKQRA